MDPVQRHEAEFQHDPEPGADIIALPQLERLPADPDGLDSGSGSVGFTTDNRSARLEALELVRAAVELADRIEKDSQETAKDRLTRTEEEVRLRRLALDEREAQLDHFKRDLEAAHQQIKQAEQELAGQRQQVAETERETQARLAGVEGKPRRRSQPPPNAPRRCRPRRGRRQTAFSPLPGPTRQRLQRRFARRRRQLSNLLARSRKTFFPRRAQRPPTRRRAPAPLRTGCRHRHAKSRTRHVAMPSSCSPTRTLP